MRRSLTLIGIESLGREAAVLADARDGLCRLQEPDGHWIFELEADATIPSEYVFLEHHLGEIDAPLQARIARDLREIQGEDGGWPLFFDGARNSSLVRRRLRKCSWSGARS